MREQIERLPQDILHVFSLNLPRFDGYPHIVLLSTLHLLLYQLIVAQELAGERSPYLVCEIVAPRKTQVRELSISSFQANSQLSLKAVQSFVDRIGRRDDWSAAKDASDAFPQCTAILNREVAWPRDDGDYDGEPDPDVMLKSLKRRATAKHGQHAGNVHRVYGRAVGLISKRGTNKMRYAPNDALLKALILANVRERMEFKEFLNLLFERYGIVIGEREAKRVMNEGDFDPKAFQSNAIRLEQRMSSLGMVRRLSDACAYVLNPYAEISQ